MPEEPKETREISTNRLEAFSDGVFAIAITLLILEFHIPADKKLGDERLKDYLIQLWPVYFAYILSFLMIGIYWANHHYIFRFYVRTNHTFLILNLLFLMSVSFLPFPTSVLGKFILNIDTKGTAVTFYAIALYVPSFFWTITWLYANHNRRLIDKKLTKKFTRYLTRIFIISNIVYLISIIVSMFYPIVSLVIIIILTFIYLLPPKKPSFENE